MNPIEIHLSLHGYREGSLQYNSCLVAGLRSSREITGRDVETGIPIQGRDERLGNWNGACGYITLLDQIGKCYQPNTIPKVTKGVPIIKALEYFASKLSPGERDAIYALRNALFHDYSLINKDNTKNFHRFKVDNHPTNQVVILPIQRWDGDINNLAQENETYVNLKALGDLVEEIYTQLLLLESQKSLVLILPGGINELLVRYLFAHY